MIEDDPPVEPPYPCDDPVFWGHAESASSAVPWTLFAFLVFLVSCALFYCWTLL